MLGLLVVALLVALPVAQDTLRKRAEPAPLSADSILTLMNSVRVEDKEAAVLTLESRPELLADHRLRQAALSSLAQVTNREATRRDNIARGIAAAATSQDGPIILGLVKIIAKLDGRDVLEALIPHVAQASASKRVAMFGAEALPLLKASYSTGRGPDGQATLRMGILFTLARVYSTATLTLAERSEVTEMSRKALDGPESAVVVGGARLALATGQLDLRARVIDLAAGRVTPSGMKASDVDLTRRLLQSALRDAGIKWRSL